MSFWIEISSWNNRQQQDGVAILGLLLSSNDLSYYLINLAAILYLFVCR